MALPRRRRRLRDSASAHATRNARRASRPRACFRLNRLRTVAKAGSGRRSRVAWRSAMDLLELVRGCTFDDFLLTPQYGVLPRRDPTSVDLTARFSQHLT